MNLNLKSVFKRRLRQNEIDNQDSNRLFAETLEDRCMLSGTWASFSSPTSIGTIMLLTDGTVMAHGSGQTNAWYKLTPDANGSYANGAWSSLSSMHYTRLYYGSNVLPDGRVFVLGGEYSNAGSWTRTGEIYNPQTNSWSDTVSFPQSQFGDGQTVLLPDGKLIAGYLSGTQVYLYNPANNTWAATGSKIHGDRSNEETWVLLSDGDVLSYDIFSSISTGTPQAQRYDFATGTWISAGTLPFLLSTQSIGYEIGSALMLPDGRVFQIGGNSRTALYDPSANTWANGPTIPGAKGADDAPSAIMPDGKILFTVDTPTFNPPSRMLEYDYVAGTITDVTTTLPSSLQSKLNSTSSYKGRMLMLPSGQMLFTPDGFSGNTMYVYTPDGSPNNSWRPTVSSITLNSGSTYTLTGTQLTGRSAGASYGDDAEMDTNYPIIQLTATDGSGHVYYARSYNWTPGVATGSATVTTQFELPSGLPQANYDLRVVASGIASDPVAFSTITATGTIASGVLTNVTSTWQTVTLSESFADPIVIVGPMQIGDSDPGTVRIRNVTSNSFQIQVNEWDYQDGTHGAETVSYLVLNRGVTTLDNGKVLMAGSVSVTDAFSTVNFSSAFSSTPVVLSTVASDNGSQAVTSRVRNVNNNGFQVRVQEEENNDGTHTSETVNYIATLPGIGNSNGLIYEVGLAPDVTHKAFVTNFTQTFLAAPRLLATMQTYNSADTANVRLKGLNAKRFSPFIEEEALAGQRDFSHW